MSTIEEDLAELREVDLSFPQSDQRKIAGLFRISPDDLFVPVNQDKLQQAKRWRTSGTKHLLERAAATLVWKTALQKVSKRTIEHLHGNPPPEDATFSLIVGFFGLGPPQYRVEKIRTMVLGAEGQMNSPFHTSAFLPKSGPRSDSRIIKGASEVRESRKDEALQVGQIARGERMDLAGIRGYTGKELEGIEKLINLRSRPSLELSPEVQGLLASYATVISHAEPRQGLFSPLSFTNFKEDSIIERLIMDLKYLEYANLRVDLLMILGSLPQILRRVGAR